MNLQHELNLNDVSVQKINDEFFKDVNIQLDVLRLDKSHPVISGNKWFKLKYYLLQAMENNYHSIATFGGAFSNHILAVAYACNRQNIHCIGYIRGNEPKHYSQTLLDAQALNMQLKFLGYEDYANRNTIINSDPLIFFIPEGGYGKTGAKGAAEIMRYVPDVSTYDYIFCACGTGTMLAGIANAVLPSQQCVGISVMKNNLTLQNEMRSLLNDKVLNNVNLLHDYSFGGYAKYDSGLPDFMNKTWTTHRLPLDFVYTAKAFYAIYDLAETNFFLPNSKILFIHSGGLQGNRSLKKSLLLY